MPEIDELEKYAAKKTDEDELEKYAAAAKGAPIPDKGVPGAPAGLPGVPSPEIRMEPSKLGIIATGAPLMSMQPGLPAAAQVPENAERMSEGAAIGAPIGGLVAGGTAALPAIGRSIAGGTIGSGVGGYGGREIGGIFGPRGRAIGGEIGAVVGGLYGGVRGARGQEPLSRASLFKYLGGTPEAPTPTATPTPSPDALKPIPIPASKASVPVSAAAPAPTMLKPIGMPSREAPIPEVEAIPVTRSGKPIPTVEATPINPPPRVSTQYRMEIPGTLQNPNLLGPKGLGGIRVTPPSEPKLLPAPAAEPAPVPTKLRYIRPAETPSMSGRGAAPAEMHPEELAEIRKEAGRPNMSPEDAHAFRINRLAGKAAETAPKNDLGGMKRAGDEPEKLTPIGAAAEPPSEPMQLKPIGERSLGEQAVKPKIENIINRAMGVKPLEPNVPLKEQFGGTAEPGETDPIKAKYPDAKVRQLVRANGEEVYEAAKHDPDLLKQLHDLNRVDLRQALINAGEDMGQLTVSNSKFAGEGSIPREEAFHRLLAKGVKPADIPELAKAKE